MNMRMLSNVQGQCQLFPILIVCHVTVDGEHPKGDRPFKVRLTPSSDRSDRNSPPSPHSSASEGSEGQPALVISSQGLPLYTRPVSVTALPSSICPAAFGVDGLRLRISHVGVICRT